MTVADTESYLAKLAEPTRSTLAALCDVIRASDEGLREEIAWNAPSFARSEHLVTTGVNRDGTVRLVLHTGAARRDETPPVEIDDPTGIFERKGPDRVVAIFATSSLVLEEAARLRRIISAWVEQAEPSEPA